MLHHDEVYGVGLEEALHAEQHRHLMPLHVNLQEHNVRLDLVRQRRRLHLHRLQRWGGPSRKELH